MPPAFDQGLGAGDPPRRAEEGGSSEPTELMEFIFNNIARIWRERTQEAIILAINQLQASSTRF